MKQVLLVFKDKKKITKNHEFWDDKLSLKFIVHKIFLTDLLHLTNLEIIKLINKKIFTKKIDFTIFEGDHVDIIDETFLELITNNTIKGLFLGDDNEWHDVNKVNASKCDFVLTSCPISKLKFDEFNVRSLFVPIEANGNIWKNYNLDKNIDVLFFGREKRIRNIFFKKLEEKGIKIFRVDPYMEISNTNEKLAKLINQSKIVLNLSASKKSKRFWSRSNSYDYLYLFKGRILISSFCQTLCLTEYDPAASLLFTKNELPQFKNVDECVELISMYLSDETKLKNTTQKFYDKGQIYLDINYINKIQDFLIKIKKKDIVNSYIDTWYILIHIKQMYRSRYKKNNLITIAKQFLENFSLYKNKKKSNFLVYIFFSFIFFLRYLPFFPFKWIRSIIFTESRK